MEFHVLGPLEVRLDDGRRRLLGAHKQRALLAMLLFHANRVVTGDQLLDALWRERPPRSACANLKTYASALRQALRPASESAPPRIVAHAGGYLLDVGRTELDLLVFEDLAAQGQEAIERGDLAVAAERLERALALWRGRPLEDMPLPPALESEVLRLEERRLAVLEDSIDVRLTLGRHPELVAELRALVATQPLRERLWGQLMLALYRCGRQADALAAYADARRHLVEELGIEPGAELQRLQHAILIADPALEVDSAAVAAQSSPATAPPVPVRQLPRAIRDFTGRRGEVASLRELLAVAPVVVAISGAPGVGKSALAIQVAHQQSDRFPDGQLYVNLQGATAGLEPLEPAEALGRFLRALGAGGNEIPLDVEEAAAKYRSLLAERRLLVVLDNAACAAQVRSLLPASAGCAVLVTSRQVLATLEGAMNLHLDVLSKEEAVALLGKLAGPARVAAEPEATAAVAQACGCLPLALRIAGARLATRPAWSLRTLTERLADQHLRLDELQVGDLAVRASFRVSYETLSTCVDPASVDAARAFRLLGLLDGPDIGIPVAAALLDRPLARVEAMLERLADEHLLESHRLRRYVMHDLLRLFAREHATHQESEAERAAAIRRALCFYLATAQDADRLLRLDGLTAGAGAERHGLALDDQAAAVFWLETERANLVAAVNQAATTPSVPTAIAWQLATALRKFLELHGYWDDWHQVNEVRAALR